jgi:ankyrin repeat protein
MCVDFCCQQWYVSFVMVTFKGKEQCVKWMLDEGIPLDRKTDNGESSVHYAAHNGHLNVLNLLIERGADICLANRYLELIYCSY